MANLLSTLLEITVYSIVLFFIILAFKKIFRKAISASLNYLVWMLLIIRLLMPVTIDSGIKLFVLPAAQTPVVQAETGTSSDSVLNTNMVTTGYTPQTQSLQIAAPDNSSGNPQLNSADLAPAPVTMDWKMVALSVWAIGMALYFAYVIMLHIRFRHMIRKSTVRVPAWVSDIVETCKKDLGIKARIKVSVQNSMISPALTLSLHPALLLPQSMLIHMSREQIELGIRHELMHYKRGDHLMSLLLLLLRGVYWFNPVVWAAYKMISADMEAACDARVTALFEKERKTLYIQTIIDLGSDQYMRYALGMSTPDGKKNIEKRIRSMFMKKKSGRTVRFAASLLVFVVMVMCFTTACQPTPAENIVIGKNNNGVSANASITSTSNGGSSNEPVSDNVAGEIWQDTIKSKDSVINIDAEVDSPSSLQTAQMQVKPAGFTADQFENFKEALLGDKELFQYKNNKDSNILTKAEIEAQIIQVKQKQSANKASGKTVDQQYVYNDPVTGEETLLGEDDYINKLSKDYETAPTTKDKESVKMEFSKASDGEQIYGLAQMDNGKVASISVNNSSDLKNNIMSYQSNMARSEYAVTAELGSNKVNGVKMTEDEAITTADNFIGKIKKDSEEFTFNKAYVGSYINDIMEENYTTPPADDVLYDQTKQCFVLYYTRKYNDLDTNYIMSHHQTIVDGPPQAYQKIYTDQYIELYINDDGIMQAQWTSPDQVTEKNDVQMLSLEKIKDIASKQIPLMNWSPDGKAIVIDIKKVKLGMMRIATQNDPGTYQVVPVWDFMGYTEGDQVSNYNQSMLTINAIDGSIIDRGLGY